MTPFETIVERSGTNSIKWDLKPKNAAGNPVHPMWVADMDFPCAPEIQEAISRRAGHPVFGYSYAPDEYTAAFRSWQERRNGWTIDPEHYLFAPAVMPAVRAAILGLTEPGDGVVVQTPVYYPFFSAIRDNGREIVENPLLEENGRYSLDFHGLEAAITPRTRMLLLCSPHNPVGRVWTADELRRLVEIAGRHDLIIVSDEIHCDIVRSDTSFVPILTIPGADARTIACHAPSKTFNLAGIASSSIVVPDSELRSAFSATLDRLGLTLPNLLSIEAAHAAYAQGEYWVDGLLAFLDEQIAWFRRETDARFPGEIAVPPIEGTYLAWLDLRPLLAATGTSHRTMRHVLFEEAALWLSDGAQFGTAGEGFFRMNLATPRVHVEEGLSRLEAAVRAAKARA
jgi:cystathionine beta-lyase